ncbi:glycosyltransferase [bacterium]|nr:glycosyltransferase [bacterium]
MTKVALLYDLGDWILGRIAREIQKQVEPSGQVTFKLGTAPESVRSLRSLEAEVDVLHYLSPHLYFPLCSRIRRPTVLTCHHLGTAMKARFATLPFPPDVLVTTNQQCQSILRGLPGSGGMDIGLTLYGLEVEQYRPNPAGREELLRRAALPPDALLVGLAAKKTSNEDDRKGFDLTWKLVEKLAEEHGPKFRLVLFGPDESKAFGWKDEDLPPSIRPFVFRPGFVAADQMPLLMAGLDFYVCLSRIEGGPYPVMEAMACGVPTISTAVGSVIGLIEDGVNGFIVTEENYIERIPELIRVWRGETEERRSLCAAAREAVLARHRWEAVAAPEVYLPLYQRALAIGSQRPLLQRLRREASSAYALARGW